MNKRRARSTTRILSVALVLALLVMVSGLTSAQPRSVTSFFVEEAKLTASDGAAGDHFGGRVSISGDTVVVGARNNNSNGSAYVFERFEPVAWVYLPVVLRGGP